MDFLKSLFGEKALTYAELEQAINDYNADEKNKDSQIKLGNLGSGEYVSRAKYEALQAIQNEKETKLENASGRTAQKQSAPEKVEEKSETKEETDYKKQIELLNQKLNRVQLDSALKTALFEAEANDVDYMLYKLKEKGGELCVGEDGKVSGIDELITNLKAQFPKQFDSSSGSRRVSPMPLPQSEDKRTAQPRTLAEALKQESEKAADKQIMKG